MCTFVFTCADLCVVAWRGSEGVSVLPRGPHPVYLFRATTAAAHVREGSKLRAGGLVEVIRERAGGGRTSRGKDGNVRAKAGRGGADCGAPGEDVVPPRCRRPPVYPNGGGKHSENLSALANCTCRSLPSCHPLPGGKIVAGDWEKRSDIGKLLDPKSCSSAQLVSYVKFSSTFLH